MGNCCTTVEPQQINSKDQMFLKKSVSRLNVTKNFKGGLEKINPINLDNDKSSFQFYINNIIHKYKIFYNLNKEFIDKISLEQIWNITKFHGFNHTESKFIVLDLRSIRNNSFLKHYNRINYKIEEIASFQYEKLERFKAFLYNKTVLLLLDMNQKTDLVDIFVEILVKNEFSVLIKIVNYCFGQGEEENSSNSNKEKDQEQSQGDKSSTTKERRREGSSDMSNPYSNNNKYFNSNYIELNSTNINNSNTTIKDSKDSNAIDMNSNSFNNTRKDGTKKNQSSNNPSFKGCGTTPFIKESINKLFISNNIDTFEFNDFPYIMASLKYFNQANSDKMIFFDYFKKNNPLIRHIVDERFTSESLSDKETLENKYFRFSKYYKISGIIIFSPSFARSNQLSKFVQNNKIIINKISSVSSFSDIAANLQEIVNSMLVMRSLLLKNKSVMFYFDSGLSKETINFLVMIVIYKLTDVKPMKLINYVIDNYFFVEGFQSFIQDKIFQ